MGFSFPAKQDKMLPLKVNHVIQTRLHVLMLRQRPGNSERRLNHNLLTNRLLFANVSKDHGTRDSEKGETTAPNGLEF